MRHAVDVAAGDARVAVRREFLKKSRACEDVRRNAVLLGEPRQVAVRIEEVAVLILAKEGAPAEGGPRYQIL